MNVIRNLLLLSIIYNVKALSTVSKDWWKYTTIYEVYIWSFKDSNGDGIGDLKGITSQLDHFVDLGVETIWISPFFHTAMKDMGYDVVNYTEIDPVFGTMDDFEELLEEMNERGLNLVIDFVINHSSDEHLWFQNSINRIEPYTDYYVWRNAKGYDENGHPLPPNNWWSIFGGSAWTWNEKRKQFFYRTFTENQPDLNLRNAAVKSELKNIIKFWFDKGVAGGRLDAAENYVEDLHFRDDLLKDANKKNPTWIDYIHNNTLNVRETYEFIHELKEYVDKRYAKKKIEKILFPEVYFANLTQTMAYYGTMDYKISNFPLNIGFVTMDKFQTPKSLDEIIKYWLRNMPAHGAANWMKGETRNFFPEIYYASLNQTMENYGTTDYKITHFPLKVGFVKMEKFPTPKSLDDRIKYWLKNMPAHGVANWNADNHDNSRVGSRLGPQFRDIMVITIFTLPGIACMYYGQEIGMMDYKVRPDQIRDSILKAVNHERDPARLPMQWDDSMNAGFSSNPKTWLPVNPSYVRNNVENQKKYPTSRYNIFKTLSKLRKTKTLKLGDFKSYFISSWVYAFSRSLAGEPTYITILNLGTETAMIDLKDSIPNVPPLVKVCVASKNFGYSPGDKLHTHPKHPQSLILRPMSAVVVSTRTS